MIIPPGFANLTVSWHVIDGTHSSSTSWGLHLIGGEGLVDLEALVGNWEDIWVPLTNAGLRFDTMTVRQTDPEGEQGEYSRPINATGTDATSVSTPNCCVLMEKRTAFLGRKRRGRNYLWQPPEGQVNSLGNLAGGYLEDMQEAANGWLLAMQLSENVDEVVLLHSAIGDAPDIIPNLVIESTIATQRRRMPRN